MAATIPLPAPTAPPALELVPPAAWSHVELDEARELSEAAMAAGAKWAFADWLLEHLPMVGRGHRTGSIARLGELGDALDASPQYLHHTAHSWPPPTRVPAASWDCHPKFYDGGPAKAERRRDVLLSLPRDRWGRITSGALRAWRQAQADQPARATPSPAGKSGTARRRSSGPGGPR